MVNKELLEKVRQLGVPLMLPEEKLEGVYKTLAEAVKSHEARLWESFPALLVSVSKKYEADLKEVYDMLKNPADKKALQDLAMLSEAVYNKYHLPLNKLNKSLEPLTKMYGKWESQLKFLSNALEHGSHLNLAGVRLPVERVCDNFEGYLGHRHLEQEKQAAVYQELSLEYALSQVFSPKQKELFYKRFNGEKLTKTEREYFSRAVKKKVQALANPELHRLARKVMG